MLANLDVLKLPLLEWADIPAGHVTVESVGSFDIKPFKITKYPITNEQFEAFIADGGYKNFSWWEGLASPAGSPRSSDWKEADAPKLQVCWFEAVAFCRWLGGITEAAVCLPTEWEWQWAAAGDSGWAYPYGKDFDVSKSNTKEGRIGRTNAVTHFAHIKTHFDTVDMSGNIWEWCLNEGNAPYNVGTEGGENRVMRGGSWNNTSEQANIASRSNRTPRTRTFNIGFRVMVAE